MKNLDDIKREAIEAMTRDDPLDGYLGCHSLVRDVIDHLHSQGYMMVWQPIEIIEDTNNPALFLFRNGAIDIAPCLKPKPLGNLSKEDRKMLYDVTGRIGGDPGWEPIAYMPLPKAQVGE